MDNYTFRTTTRYTAMNPDRTTKGGRLKLTTSIPAYNITNVSGFDFKDDIHTGRSAMMKSSAQEADSAMFSAARVTDFDFSQIGFFNESTYDIDSKQKSIFGIRVDKHEVLDNREKFGMLNILNPNYLHKDKSTLTSGFIRYENNALNDSFNYYIGFGHSERFPDYWERTVYNLESEEAKAYIPKTEKNNQFDAGINWKKNNLSGSISLFYSKVKDYIQTRWFDSDGNPLTIPYGMGSTSYTQVTNIDATLYGTEIDMTYYMSDNFRFISALSYVHGQNDTDNKPLAQQPPLELKLGAIYNNSIYSAGLLARFVSKQDRYDIGNGNIVMMGADIGETPGFSVFSVNAGYKYNKNISFSAGIDNILDKAYAEHLSRTDPISSLVGYTGQEKINEPGRNIWFEVKITF